MGAPSGTGSRPADGAASVSTKGFDPSRFEDTRLRMVAAIDGFEAAQIIRTQNRMWIELDPALEFQQATAAFLKSIEERL